MKSSHQVVHDGCTVCTVDWHAAASAENRLQGKKREDSLRGELEESKEGG